jgi:hypothetical protein
MDGMTKVVLHSTFALEGWHSLIESYQTHQSTKMHVRQNKQVTYEAAAVQQMVERGDA